MLSIDSIIMKPPYVITSKILTLISTISEKNGEINANFMDKPSLILRKQNKIKTIHSSLKIEGNTLTEDQITALIDNKKILGPQKDIQEVLNAIKVYDNLDKYKSTEVNTFLKAHKDLMSSLIKNAGSYRGQSVGIVKGNNIEHIAPPYENVPYLINDLFEYLKTDELELVKSCVFHYEMEFIHPFIDGNGRMGRLWQTIILSEKYPIFEYLPFETLISDNQSEYYNALSECDKLGNSTVFIEYMLKIIDMALLDILSFNNRNFNSKQRLEYFNLLNILEFTRKDYMNVFKDISSSTATRDLIKGIELKLFYKEGENNKTKYISVKDNDKA